MYIHDTEGQKGKIGQLACIWNKKGYRSNGTERQWTEKIQSKVLRLAYLEDQDCCWLVRPPFSFSLLLSPFSLLMSLEEEELDDDFFFFPSFPSFESTSTCCRPETQRERGRERETEKGGGGGGAGGQDQTIRVLEVDKTGWPQKTNTGRRNNDEDTRHKTRPYVQSQH